MSISETLGPAAPVKSIAPIFYEGEELDRVNKYVEDFVITGVGSELLREIRSEMFSAWNAKEVITSYHLDQSFTEYLSLMLYKGMSGDRAGGLSTLAIQATILTSALSGHEWQARTREMLREMQMQPLDAFRQSQPLMAGLLRLSRIKRLNAGLGRDVSADLAEKVLERSPGIKKVHEDLGRPVADTLASTTLSFVSLASRNAAIYALRGALPFAGKRNTAAFGSQFRRITEVPVDEHSHILSVPARAIATAADFAKQASQGRARSPMGEELREAVVHFANEAKSLLFMGMVLVTGAGAKLPEDYEHENIVANRAALEAQRQLAEQRRLEAQVQRQQKAERERTDFDKFLAEISEINKANDEFAQGWTFTGNYLKKNGLNELIGSLVRGLKNADHEIVFPGISKEHAKQMVCTIEKLAKLFVTKGGAKEVHAEISAESQLQDRLAVQVDTLRQNINSLGASYRQRLMNAIPELFSTEAVVAELSDNYPKLRDAIKRQHPKGSLVISVLDEFFRPAPEQETDSRLTVVPIPEAVDPEHRLSGIAKQLDQIILPPKATIEDLKREIFKLDLPDEEIESIDWERLYDLVTLRDIYDGTLYRSKKGSLGGAPPYYVVVIEYEGNIFAVAESPVEGNATYIISQREIGGSWLEALTHTKAEARILGAHRIVHRNGSSHIDKIENCLVDLMTIE